MDTENYTDVIIVGAGISGIGAAWHLLDKCPSKKFTILESRDDLGGTWDLFRYPGIRSDSDMYTLGYGFKPWEGEKSIADGADIQQYVRSTAKDAGILEHIRYGHSVSNAQWCSATGRWSIDVKLKEGGAKKMTCSYFFVCAGYYDYDAGYTPEFAGSEQFKGNIVHPQHWPDDIDYKGKRVVVIGSGATAITLIPSLARDAAHVTMLQRSPTYIASLPSRDIAALRLRKFLPKKVAYNLTRWKHISNSVWTYYAAKRWPELAAKLLIGGVKEALGEGHDIKRHFVPKYKPWDQRVCLVPDGDLFEALKAGSASVVTDHIESFTESGIKLKSGDELAADLIVTATGLNMTSFGGINFVVDGKQIELNQSTTYKAMMCSGIPNMFMFMGYTNSSWTLKIDLTAEYSCRLINYNDKNNFDHCVPQLAHESMEQEALINFSSGYILRAQHLFPKQGTKAPWKIRQNYIRDRLDFLLGKINDGAMSFGRNKPAVADDIESNTDCSNEKRTAVNSS